jgi:imidazoleglycerol phosphate synthase glutamine amidotransferase subunit HisH
MTTVAIANIPGTNRRNLVNCLHHDVDFNFVDTPNDISGHTLILPGVSNFGHYIDFLDSNGWKEFLLHTKRKVIGICAGYHALCEGSEESPSHAGLGLLQGRASLINADASCSPLRQDSCRL